LRIILDCQGSHVHLVCFNREFLAKSWPKGTRLSVRGVFESSFEGLSTASFEALPLDDPYYHLEFGRLVPIYGLTEGITQRTLRRLVDQGLKVLVGLEHDLPEYLAKKRKIASLADLLAAAHYPRSLTDGEAARDQLAYAELFFFQVGVLSRRARLGRTRKSQSYATIDVRADAEGAYGFTLTKGQALAWEGLQQAMRGDEPMQTLLLGDVGSGKTALAAMAILLAVRSGLQVALAAPTVILARQLAMRMRDYLSPLGVRTAFFHGSMQPVERQQVLAGMAAHEIDLVAGTHALFQEDVVFARLGLVVIDEQHRFGVNQRKALREKGEHADYLAMSATPIPRTLALTIYGDYQSIRIEGLPSGRRPVKTIWVNDVSRIGAALADVEARILRGEQACFVYPAIGDTDADSDKAASAAFARYAALPLASRGIALLHGRLDDSEKTEVMDQFTAGRLGLLITTSVIEVGIDHPGLTAMVIFEADRFGLSQLHQLRGRVGRGHLPSVCYLVTDGTGSEAAEVRMSALLASNDGFRIAEADLALRGPGDFLGVAQTGLPEFAVANIVRDGRLLDLARKDAAMILDHDPLLESPHNERLARNTKEGGYE
jgi:ATP-dependent DNA helicase RecG